MWKSLSKAIDTLNVKQGELASLLMLPLLIIVVFEVMMRYAFNKPTIWGFEVTIFLYGVHFILGYAYCDVLGGHVRVDVVTMRLSSKTKAVLECFALLILFFPFMTMLTIWVWKFALMSVGMKELNSTSWAPPIYPIKVLMAVGFTFLLLQGVSHLIKNLSIVFNKTAQ